ncbi:tyrosine-type recombinase/integrase [Janthinobacterium sp. RT4P48]|uniref:tyrosine-type recombinase/integrase n=1 Tax=Janthinobacterium sp. RT4P48 TaxID=3424188 RepID=UPI003F251D4C
MASITKQKTGWRVQISVKGTRDSSVLPTKAEAQAWAVEREAQMRRMVETGVNTDKTCQDAFDRYSAEVSPHKRGARWEGIRLAAIARHVVDRVSLGEMKLCDVTADVLGQWRDERLLSVAGSTVNRDLNLLSHVFTTARREWKWISSSPTVDVRRPQNPQPRDRRITDDEIERICLALGFDGEVTTKSSAIAVAFLFAIETAMRAGEICGLTWVDIEGNVAHLPRTKNGTKRSVPLSGRAIELLGLLPPGNDTCFGISTASLDALFRKARGAAGVDDLTFHDTRHEAITRLAKKLNVLELARMVGHKDLTMLQIYYNETAAELAKKL